MEILIPFLVVVVFYFCFAVENEAYIYSIVVQLEDSVVEREEAEGPLKSARGLQAWL